MAQYTLQSAFHSQVVPLTHLKGKTKGLSSVLVCASNVRWSMHVCGGSGSGRWGRGPHIHLTPDFSLFLSFIYIYKFKCLKSRQMGHNPSTKYMNGIRKQKKTYEEKL